MGDINDDGDRSGPWARTTAMVRCSVRCAWRIGLWFEFRSTSDVRARGDSSSGLW